MAILRNKTTLGILTVGLLGLSIITVAKVHKTAGRLQRKPQLEMETNSNIMSQMLFSEYERLMKTIDPARKEYAQSGKLLILNEIDSANILPETPFLVVRKDNDCYYRVGATETYNMAGVYVQIDHRSKNVLAGRQKAFVGQVFTGGKLSQKKIKEEGYQLKAGHDDKGNKSISLSNPEHLSYKEYTISYDTSSGKVLATFTRTANNVNPEAKGQGKLIYVQFSKVPNEAKLTNYDPFTIIKQKNKGFELTGKYKGYHLIVM